MVMCDMVNRIKELREEKGMTQQRLSIELGVTQEAVSGYENGRHCISVPCLLKLSEMFNVSCDYILCLSDIRNMTSVKDLSPEEIELISEYRTLLPSERAMLKGYIKGISDNRIKKKGNST